MRKEMLDKIKVHYIGSNSLEEYLPVDALPKEAGGSYKDGLALRGIYLKSEAWVCIIINKVYD